jgi:hypothetical protein
MKKNSIMLLCLFILSFVLYGCGMNRTEMSVKEALRGHWVVSDHEIQSIESENLNYNSLTDLEKEEVNNKAREDYEEWYVGENIITIVDSTSGDATENKYSVSEYNDNEKKLELEWVEDGYPSKLEFSSDHMSFVNLTNLISYENSEGEKFMFPIKYTFEYVDDKEAP